MSALQPAEADPSDVSRGTAAFISRQPVLDAQRRVTGYRVAYATGDGGRSPASEGADTRLFGDVISVVGLEELVGETLAHLPISRRLLLTLGVPPVRPDQVVLRVTFEHACDPELRLVLEALAGRGYSLSLYDLPGPALEPDLLGLFGIVEVDCARWESSDRRAAVRTILDERAAPLAVGLQSEEAFQDACEIGFELFAGSFYSSPRHTEVRNVPVGALGTLAAVAQMQGAGGDIDELVKVIDRDLGLSVKLLRYINSAYFGMRSQITSIRQAVMMLGSRGVSRWAMMVALTGGTAAPPELSVMALTRARMCEVLASARSEVAGDEMFLIGLLSLADALLDVPLAVVLDELPLADHLAAALLERSGPAGAILDAVISYEVGSFEASSVQAHRGTVADAYLDGLRWARESVRGMAD
ncbi:MAG TPA: HDOD domain-containing protein [Solirubrobacteraceae bacterium]|nr:HDOD domain-containing protein [Solirubrobacteraceae bacterium]